METTRRELVRCAAVAALAGASWRLTAFTTAAHAQPGPGYEVARIEANFRNTGSDRFPITGAVGL